MKRRRSQRGVTLLELLVSLAILGIVLLVIAQAMNTMQNTWVSVRGKADGFRNTRLALDTVTHRLSQATLNSRWRADDTRLQYVRDSDLHFVSGKAPALLNDFTKAAGHGVFFQAPFGQDAKPANSSSSTSFDGPLDTQALDETLNAWGYFVEFGSDADERPDFMQQSNDRFPPRRRFRLLEFRQPAHELTLFDLSTGQPPQLLINQATTPTPLYTWFRVPLAANTYRERHVSMVAENVLAIILTPLDSKLRSNGASADAPFQVAPDGEWDSRRFQWEGPSPPAANTEAYYQWHRLPPAYQVTAIATSEDSWMAMTDGQIESTADQLRTLINGLFTQGAKLEDDLNFVQQTLDAMKPRMRYKIISILVPLAGQ